MFKRKYIDRILSEGLFKASRSGHFKHPKENSAWEDSLIFGFQDFEKLTSTISPWRTYLLFLPVVVIFALLFIKLFSLQIIEGANNRDLADSNRIKIKTIHAPRGVIYDRNGKILAQNEPGFRLIEDTPDGKKTKILSRDEALNLEVENDPLLSNLEVDSLRFYPGSEITSHVVGYIGEISEEELANPSFEKYSLGDRVGRGGIEQYYEEILRGKDGGEVIEVDVRGKKIRSLRQTAATPGQNIYLSIDKDLQEVAFNKLKQALEKSNSCCGAAILQNPQNGEILALVSLPSFDPAQLDEALQNPNSSLLNRVIAGTYPPGSVFKIASSLAGLSSGKIKADTQFEDTGVVRLGQSTFANWYFTQYGKTEGFVDLVKALKRSNDIYFYRLGQIIGEEELKKTAESLGMNRKLGIDLPGEEAGLIPDNNWKVANFDQVWYPGDTLHMAIGQGFVLVTPLQLNNLISIVAANGNQYPPHLVLKITNSKDELIKEVKFNSVSKVELSSEYLNLVKKGLSEVPKMGGTAWPFFSFPIPTAGKTGTAEYGDPGGKTHAWYSAFGPVEDPKVAVTILVEGGGEGSSVSAPIAREILRWYFSKDKSNLIKDGL